ncbi:hypothetical protein KBD08_03300 [Candidatus Babeliales bacterium]|nr:hypothetical protein [Candidatus Babeliales bacterium]
MKSLYIVMLTTCLVSNMLIAKKETTKKQNSKTITISISPKPTVDMQINFNSSYRLDNAIITPDTSFIEIDIEKSSTTDSVNFFIFPLKLYKYTQQPKEKRKNYNANEDLKNIKSSNSGEERLFQALSTSVKYSYDQLPKHITLPNPMTILNELLDCPC